MQAQGDAHEIERFAVSSADTCGVFRVVHLHNLLLHEGEEGIHDGLAGRREP